MVAMDEPTLAPEKPPFDFESKNAPVTPPQDPTSVTMEKDSVVPPLAASLPDANSDSTTTQHYLGLHPGLSNGVASTPDTISQTTIPPAKDITSLEQPVENIPQGIQPTAPFVPEQRENPTETDVPDPSATTTVPPSIDQPTSDVRDEPLAQPPVLDSGIAHPEQQTAAGNAVHEPLKQDSPERSPGMKTEAEGTGVAAVPADALAVPTISSSHDSAVLPTSEKRLEDTAVASFMAPSADGTQAEDAVLADSSADVAPPVAAPTTGDLEMIDAPVATAANGVVRPREEDEEDEPAAKRTKTDDQIIAEPSIEFKKPDLPALTTDVSAPMTDLVDTPTAVTPSAVVVEPLDATPVSHEQKKYLVELLRRAKKTKDALPFLMPVDPVALGLPTYYDTIKEPMDLSTIETKLKADKYTSVDDMIRDICLMVQNTHVFNGPAHAVTQSGENTRAYLLKSMKLGLPRKGATPVPKPVKEKPAPAPRPALPRRESRAANVRTSPGSARSPGAETYALQPDGTPLIRRDSTANDGRPKREIHRPQPKDLPYQSARPKKKKHQTELKFCTYVIKELMKKEHSAYAYPFYDPVDPVALNIPSYHKIIKKPMDLGTIQSNLKNGLYSNGKEFKTDVELIFANCFKFNPSTDGVNQMGKQLEEVFKKLWEQKDDWIREHSTPETRSDEEDEDDEDEEEEEEEEEAAAAGIDATRLAAIQAQIHALNAEMTNLVSTASAGTRKSPTAKSTKKSKKTADPAAPPKKAKRTSSTAAAPASAGKAAKAKKPQKIPKLTQEQKREVSEGIGLLDDAGMRKAVQIIRNGVPSLQNVNDDELELDIDEIPDAVVYDLYKFVRSLRPKAIVADVVDDGEYAQEPDDDDFVPPARARGSTAGGAGPGRKKNKPMTATAQEAKIQELTDRLQAFKNQGGEVGSALAAAQAQTGSATPDEDDDEDAEGSSSEEE